MLEEVRAVTEVLFLKRIKSHYSQQLEKIPFYIPIKF